MNLKSLSDLTLSLQLTELVQKERRTTLEILHHLLEFERRQLFAAQGFPSLFEYCVRKLGLSEGAAQRRISSMRLLRDLPEIEPQLAQGTLSLSVASQAQSFFRNEEIKSPETKREILESLNHKSSRDAEIELASRAQHPERHHRPRPRPISKHYSRLHLVVSNELLSQIEELRGLLAHTPSGKDLTTTLAHAVSVALEKHRPKRPKVTQPKNLPPTSAVKRVTPSPAKLPSRRIPEETKRQVWARDGGKCTYRDLKTGQTCHSRFRLQFDHIQPFAMGGATTAQNLRLLCSVHNQYLARKYFEKRAS